tara:strand:- start:267 stop:509 length:243 start_codon:yes stop_codon:yes gene_type:complete
MQGGRQSGLGSAASQAPVLENILSVRLDDSVMRTISHLLLACPLHAVSMKLRQKLITGHDVIPQMPREFVESFDDEEIVD